MHSAQIVAQMTLNNVIKYSNQLAIYKLGWGLELETTKKQTRIEAFISRLYGSPPKKTKSY